MEFLAGVWLSEIIRRGKIPGVKTAVAMLFIGLFGFVASLRGPTPELWRFIFWGGPSLLVKSLKLLGDGSYSIYRFHPFVLKSVATPLAKFCPYLRGSRRYGRRRRWPSGFLHARAAAPNIAETLDWQCGHRSRNGRGIKIPSLAYLILIL